MFACLAFSTAAVWAAEKGPTAPAALWVYKVPEQFVASPVAGPGVLYVSGLAAFNTGNFHALSLDPAAKDRELWSKSPPYLKLPTVSAPAIADGKIIFGDGMHQTDGAILHCVDGQSGRPVWQFVLPGELVHLEGTPAVAGGRAYFGGGNAGVVAIDMGRVTLDGKEMTPAEGQAALDALWKAALARFEEEKKKDPTFAVPPSDDSIPKPAPKLLWQMGQGKWHVDGSVALAGDRLLVASTYLDKEQAGDRAIYCLAAADGSTRWRAELKYNPWAGPVVAGDQVLVATSSIRLDPKTLKGAKGEILVLRLDDGSVVWRKEVAGGVVSPPVVRGELVLFTASDGKLRAWNRADGEPRWVYDAKMPVFAGPAAADDVAYIADLKAAVHAVGLDDGKQRWTFDLGTDPAVKAPGMVYGTPLLHEGRLYVGTCNLEAVGGQQRPGAVICIGNK